MMFGDLEIPSAGRVRWLWPGTAVGSSADHRCEPNSTENFSCFIEKHLKNQKTKPRANKKQDQKKTHHQQKNTKKTEEHPGFAFIIIYLFFLVILPVGLFFGYLLLYIFFAKINFLC